MSKWTGIQLELNVWTSSSQSNVTGMWGNSQVPPQTFWLSSSQGGTQQASFKKPSRWLWWMLKFETQSIGGTSEACRDTDQRTTLPAEQVRKAPEKKHQMSWPYWTIPIVRNSLMTENQILKRHKKVPKWSSPNPSSVPPTGTAFSSAC